MSDLIWLAVAFLGALILSLDIALAMLFATTVILLFGGIVPLHLIAEKAVSQVKLFPLLAIPGFILMGELMNMVGLTRSLGELARKIVGRWRGGMGAATVVACMFFGGMTGSGLAETVAIGMLMIPMLTRHGYPKEFSAAMIAAGGSLGPIIPPSIPMVIYASIAPTVSVSALFIGGIVPGILIGLSFLVIVVWRTRAFATADMPLDGEEEVGFGRTVLDAVPALVAPAIVLGGVLGGVVTVTEASVLAATYVALFGFVTGRLRLGDLGGAAMNTATATGTFGFIIAAAGPFSFFLALFDAPGLVGTVLTDFSGGNTVLLMLVLTAILIGLGCLVEATSLVIILAPILAATASAAGIDQLHMALVSICALMLGLFTPPVGTNLFAITGIAQVPIERISREIIPFAFAAAAVVALMAAFPQIVLFLPQLVR
ncbi:TRAP transporter large permease [Xanthobacter tagetidis]|jgi:C4-dicarboxylate transporter DctM subunit|nr:TRAP transporter large permease [Xanthobacter tagetidis]MBB6309783.1 C4-dicarboxylate transporter DctM subunit [Xanthobacter tagetidis]